MVRPSVFGGDVVCFMATDNKIMIELVQSTIQTCTVSKTSLLIDESIVHNPVFGGIL